ncbi:MAG: NAD(P)/FAD-dependent oxidoreductase [Smithellaceae bacterium]|nr:NAD(P)/FAD-dependent oxidoreductase [Smithellaceae bacterium]
MQIKNTDVTIIGAGPAGMAAAIQLARFGLQPLLLEQAVPGGLLWNANLVENYPGFPAGITGPDLVGRFTAHLERVGGRATREMVKTLDHDGKNFLIETHNNSYLSPIVVIASGTTARRPCDIEISEGVSERIYYEINPLAGVADQDIVIVGAGDAAFDYALNLGRRNQITILNRDSMVKCLPLLAERVAESERIKYKPNARVTRVAGEGAGGLLLELEHQGERTEVRTDCLVFAIGREPNIGYLSASIRANAKSLEHQGLLYWAGDVKNGIFRQTAIAVGDGIRTAMMIWKLVGDPKDETDRPYGQG